MASGHLGVLAFLATNLAACGFEHGEIAIDGRLVTSDDASANLGQTCLGPGGWKVCFDPPPTSPSSLTGTLDTGGTSCQPAPSAWLAAGQPDACFVIGNSITITNLVVTGSRPLVLVAIDTLTVTNLLDVSSHLGGSVGPGAPYAGCPTFLQNPANGSLGGGGAGGSFVAQGGNGGYGSGGESRGGTAAAGVAAPMTLRAGCTGQQGGAGIPGPAGGAVYLLAGASVTGAGVVHASGAGGTGAIGGGSGGGAGGMIVVSAPSITIARLIANGGGGSAGGVSQGGAGLAGSDPNPASPMVVASGGTGPGGPGGKGSAGASVATNGSGSGDNAAGGGGGGAQGYIATTVALTTTVASPAAAIVP